MDKSLTEAVCNPSKGIKKINSGKSRFALAHSASRKELGWMNTLLIVNYSSHSSNQ